MYELNGSWPEPLEIFVGIIEVISLVALWTSFAAPSFYQRWVGKGQESA